VRTAAKFLGGLGVFGLVVGVVYWFISGERAGTVLLVSFGIMLLLVVAWILRSGLTVDGAAGPQDDADATPGDAAGETVGSFPGTTLWPAFLVLGVVVTGAGLVYGALLLPIGIAIAATAVLGLMRESRT
jgi:Cytochrome c oxidase subunit IV